MDLDSRTRKKLAAAALAVGIALAGIISGIRWLTVIALAVWLAAMVAFGTGKRRVPSAVTEENT